MLKKWPILMMMMLAMAGVANAAYSGTPTAEANFATETINSKTCYKIGSAEDLYGFAAIVNGTNGNTAEPTACGVLTADIVVNEHVLTSAGELNTALAGGFIEWTPIGNNSTNRFQGAFNGQGHTISGLYFNNPGRDNVGLFGYTFGAVTIDNVGVVDSYFRGSQYVGSIVGQAALVGTKKLTVTRSYNKGFVKGTSNVGGLVGKNGNVKFSYNTGSVTGTSNVGGLVGSNVEKTNIFEINGSYNVGLVKMGTGSGNAVLGEGCPTGSSQSGTVKNVYYLEGAGDACLGAHSMTSYEFADGFVAITLHYDPVTGANIWGQIVGTDKTPLLTGEIVFPITLDNSDNCYEISNADDLYIFAAIVNSGFESDACGKLTKDIVVNENVLANVNADGSLKDGVNFKEWTPIGFGTNMYERDNLFSGEFHGQGHTISGLYFNDSETGKVGLFGNVSGTVTIDGVGLVDSYINAGGWVGGLVGFASGSLTISDSYNASSVNTPDLGFGGLVGAARSGLLTISNSYNEGSLNGVYWGGGLVGYADALVVSNSYNVGSMHIGGSGEDAYIGGITSSVDNASTVTNSYNYGEINYSTENSVSKDDLVPEGGVGKVTVTNSFTIGESRFEGDGSTKKSVTEFADGTVLAALSNAEGGDVWRQYSGDAYPTFVKKSGTTFEPNAEGYYEIATADDLYKFAEIVNNGTAVGSGTELGVKAKLMNDICVNACGEGESVLGTGNANIDATTGAYTGSATGLREWTPIGNATNMFQGTFDGQGYSVSGLYFNDDQKNDVGLFGRIKNASVKNVGVKDSYFNGNEEVGGVVGRISTTSELKNVYNAAVVKGSRNVAGVIGYASVNDGNTMNLLNVYNVGSIFGGANQGIAGLIGTLGASGESTTFENCYNYGSIRNSNGLVYGPAQLYYFSAMSGRINNVNSYFLKGGEIAYEGGMTAAEFADGTVFAQLHSAEGGEDWLQYAGDAYPTLVEKTGTPMHVAVLHYSETDSEVIAYTEGSAKSLPTTLPDGSIVVGDWYKSNSLSGDAYTKIAVTENVDLNFYAKAMKLDSDGYYEIADADMLFKFAELVNTQNSTYGSAKVKLTADIVVNENVLTTASGTSNVNAKGAYIGDASNFRKWTPIGNSTNKFQGTFDGQGHTISGLYVNEPQACPGGCPNNVNIGLFGAVANATDDGTVFIRNVGVEDSYFAGHSHIGGIVGDFNSEGNLNIENSYSVATIYATAQSGGLAGYIQNTNVKIENSYSDGNFKCNDECGALVGSDYSLTMDVANSYYLEGVKSKFGTAASSDAFANGTVATLLHGDGTGANSLWGQNVTGGESHPTFFKGINVVGPGVIAGGPETFTITLLYPDATDSLFTYVEGWGASLPEKDKKGDYVIWYDGSGNFYNEISSTVSGNLYLHAVVFKLDKDGFYEIDDVAKLYKFAAIVNGGNGDVNAKLSKDIEVNKNVLATAGGEPNVDATTGAYTGNTTGLREWTPIGYCDEDLNCLPFTGIFDGQGHTISGLYFNDSEASSVGLFGYVEGDGATVSISNVGVEDSYFKAYAAVGGIVGGVDGDVTLNIENVYNAATIVGDENGFDVGGLVGENYGDDISISNSFNYGTVSCSGEYCSALIGYNEGTVSVTNSFYLANESSGSYGEYKTATEFADGTVLSKLREQSRVWVQNPGDKYPTIDVNASADAKTIVLDWTSADDSRTLADAGYTDGAMVIVKSGKQFYAGGAIYEGILSAAQVATIADNKLYPISGVELETVGDKLVATLDGRDREEGGTAPAIMIPFDLVVDKVIYKRKMIAGIYQTVMLPFDISSLKPYKDDFAFYNFTRMDENVAGYRYMAMVYQVGKFKANMPYIVKNLRDADADGIVFEGPFTLNTVSSGSRESSATSDDGGITWSMKGVYENKVWETGDSEIGSAYLFAGQEKDGYKIGEFAKLGAGSSLQPMRMYLLKESLVKLARPGLFGSVNHYGSPESIGVMIVDSEEFDESEETMVEKRITVIPTVIKSNRWYDMKGRALDSKPTAKGNYYHNGKRVIIK